MSISGTTLYNKIKEIMPGILSGLTSDLVNKSCDDPSVQSFIKWFCSHVDADNVLTTEDLQLSKHIKKQGEWLDGEELDKALAEAMQACPSYARLLESDRTISAKVCNELEVEKEAYREDLDYVQELEDSLKNLRQLSIKLDDEIELEELQLEKDGIRVNKLYEDCTSSLDEFDLSHQQFFQDIESLLHVYSMAAEKKGPPIVWSQVPLDNFLTQMDIHYEYFKAYLKQHFGCKVERDNDSDFSVITEDEKDHEGDDRCNELLNCQTNIITSTIDKITTKAEDSATMAVAEHATDIYRNSSQIIPQTDAQICSAITALTARRDFLEKNTELLRATQLKALVIQYAKFKITQILVNNGHLRASRRMRRLEKVEKLRELAREKGHAHSELLCRLMQLQIRRLKEIVDFVECARHYLSTEYSLSSVRVECMRQQQAKFDAVTKLPPKEQNVFNKFLISMTLGPDSNPADLNVATTHYDQLIDNNEKQKNVLLGSKLDDRIGELEKLEEEIMSVYHEEIKGPTHSFKSVSCELLNRMDDSSKRVRVMQDSVNEIREKIKNMSRKTAAGGFERDTTIMWQYFLANHEALVSKYNEATRKIENSHFASEM